MPNILAIDPGPENQGYVLYSPQGRRVLASGNVTVDKMLSVISTVAFRARPPKTPQVFLVIEEVVFMGKSVGKEVFMTCRNSGEFKNQWPKRKEVTFLSFPKCRSILGLDAQSKEPGVKRWITERLSEYHDIPRTKLKGGKKNPGPLYGIDFKGDYEGATSHAWSALHVAVAFDVQYFKANYYV